MRPFVAILAAFLLVPGLIVTAQTATPAISTSSVHLIIPAVGQTDNGTYVGVASDLTVTIQTPGTGQVYLSTEPLTQLDMQGSARLAVATAESITGLSARDSDFFFRVRTSSDEIGGPSAGGAMAVAVTALLEGWTVREDVAMTGMINPDGSIGPVGGIPQKLEAVARAQAKTFLVPLGQAVAIDENTKRAVDLRELGRDRYGIEVLEAADLYDAQAPFTGHTLTRNMPTTNPLEDESYRLLTANLSASLYGRVATRVEDVVARKAKATNINSQNAGTIQDQIDAAQGRLLLAREAQNRSKNYQGASYAFQASVSIGFAEGILQFFESKETVFSRFVASYVGTTQGRLDAVETELRPTYPITAARIDPQAAGEVRFMDALRAHSLAGAAYDRGDSLDALRQSSFARERADSTRWWLDIATAIPDFGNQTQVSQAMLATLLDRYAEAAQLNVQYAALIAPDSPLVDSARTAIATSQSAADLSFSAAALYELVAALADVSTALVSLAGTDPVEKRLPDLQNAAAFQVELAQSKGIPTIYALSLLELGETRGSADPMGAYEAYSEARLAARTSLLAAGIPDTPPQVGTYVPPSGPGLAWPGWSLLVLILGFQGAAAIIVIVATRRPAWKEPTGLQIDSRAPDEAPPFRPGPPVWTGRSGGNRRKTEFIPAPGTPSGPAPPPRL